MSRFWSAGHEGDAMRLERLQHRVPLASAPLTGLGLDRQTGLLDLVQEIWPRK